MKSNEDENKNNISKSDVIVDSNNVNVELNQNEILSLSGLNNNESEQKLSYYLELQSNQTNNVDNMTNSNFPNNEKLCSYAKNVNNLLQNSQEIFNFLLQSKGKLYCF